MEVTVESTWDNPIALTSTETDDIVSGTATFFAGGWLYKGTSVVVGRGGMGAAYELMRRPIDEPDSPGEIVVGKLFSEEYLYQLRTDEFSRNDHTTVLRNFERIQELGHPNLLHIYVAHPIADNHLTISPRMHGTLHAAVVQGQLSTRKRVELLIQALIGLKAMHERQLIHRDFTLRNILVSEDGRTGCLFDFDLTLHKSELAGATYRERYRGRVVGSPGYSVAPEVVESSLLDCQITEALDIYAIGSALFGLFTQDLPYGETEDMWDLLLRIADGLVRGGESHIIYPSTVPDVLKPIIERCLERNPSDRYPSVQEVLTVLRQALKSIEDAAPAAVPAATIRYGSFSDDRLQKAVDRRRDRSVHPATIFEVDQALESTGYEIHRSLGCVKGHPIFLANPNPTWVAEGRFPSPNIYPKIVTAIDLKKLDDPSAEVERWLGGYLPVLRAARRGLLTSLYRVVHDDRYQKLLLFSDYVDDARFGTELAALPLSPEESLCLGLLVAGQIGDLHRRGLAHNNIRPESLLLKGVRRKRLVEPAMIGLVVPTFDPDDRKSDVTDVAKLVLRWFVRDSIDGCDEFARVRLQTLHEDLTSIEKGQTVSIEELEQRIADGLSAIDFNFGVLREHGGDGVSYAVLLMSLRLFDRLW